MSPDFALSVYVNDLTSLLTNCGFRCRITDPVNSCISFADESKSKNMVVDGDLPHGDPAPLTVDRAANSLIYGRVRLDNKISI